MSKLYLGIDTSNYTSSCAVYDPEEDSFDSEKQLLPVALGQLGLRQSDAVFHHTKNLPGLLSGLCGQYGDRIVCVSSSYAPRDAEGSYMPCFSVGEGFGDVLASAFHATRYHFSHQAGHIAAALWSSGRADLQNEKFIAFHFSGGTSDVLYVEPDNDSVFKITLAAGSLDLKAGQAVDRVGKLLNLPFPSGKYIDGLACESDREYKIKPYIKDGWCSFSGVQNKCESMVKNGEKPCDTAKYCIDCIYAAVRLMTEHALKKYGDLPLIYAGGVMCNSIIRKRIAEEYGGFFASPEFSSDNAAGTAYLGYIKENRKI